MSLPIILDGAAADWKGTASGHGGVVLYDATGTAIGTTANPVKVSGSFSDRVVGSVGVYGAASFRIPGVAATSQNLCTVRNNAGARKIALRRVAIDVSYSAAATDLLMGYFRVWPNTGVTPSGGSAPTKHRFSTSFATSQAETEILFAASADGTGAAITHALPGATSLRQQARTSIHTAVGAIPPDDYELQRYDHQPIEVLSGETLLIAVVGSANDVTSRHYTVKLIFEEFT